MRIIPTSPEEKAVYDALRAVFKGENAKMRRLKVVRDRINKTTRTEPLSLLLKRHGLETVSLCAQDLLENLIFSSEADAQKRFACLAVAPKRTNIVSESPKHVAKQIALPDGTESTRTVTPEPEASPPQDNISGATATRNFPDSVSEQYGLPNISPVSMSEDTNTSKSLDEMSEKQVQHEKSALSPATASKQPLCPTTLPFDIQHHLMVRIECFLEQAAFDFAQHHAPEMLATHNWDCAEAVELNTFAWCLSKLVQRQPPTTAVAALTPKLASSVVRIRHAAVHRERLTNRDIETALTTAEHFLVYLGDETRGKQLADLAQTTCEAMARLEREEQAVDDDFAARDVKFQARLAAVRKARGEALLAVERARARSRRAAAGSILRGVEYTMAAAGTSAGKRSELFSGSFRLLLALGKMIWAIIWCCLILFMAGGARAARGISVISRYVV